MAGVSDLDVLLAAETEGVKEVYHFDQHSGGDLRAEGLTLDVVLEMKDHSDPIAEGVLAAEIGAEF